MGTEYSQTLSATGDAPITWSLESGALPTGLNLLGNGTISGTPTTANTFNFTVKATNTAGNDTKALTIVIAPEGTLTVPNAVATFSVTPGDTQVVLTWTVPSNNGGSAITGYEVTMDNWTNKVTKTASELTHTYTGLTNGQSYTFKVRALNAQGSGTESTQTATPSGTPPTVTGVLVNPTTASLTKGGIETFTAIVNGTNNPAQTVTWSIDESGKHSQTVIGTDGVLTINSAETLATLTVRATSTVDTSKSGVAIVTVTGSAPIALTISTTQEWSTALTTIRLNPSGNYTLTVSGNVAIPGINSVSEAMNLGFTPSGSSLAVTLNGNGKLYLNSQGQIITVGVRQTLIIDSPTLTLEGLKNGQNEATQDNNRSVVRIEEFGNLELKAGTISGNTSSSAGGGVYVNYNANFTMSGGVINGNTTNSNGGGVFVNTLNYDGGTFSMTGGTISGNTSVSGGGVFVSGYGDFTISNGNISNNTASSNGGGVYLSGPSTMTGGTISGNTALQGGGVAIDWSSGSFTKSGGGTIYGKNEAENSNTAYSDTYGHAVIYFGFPAHYRYTTLNAGDNLSTSNTNIGWGQ